MIRKPRHVIALWLLKPPYDGVIWLAWLFVVASCLIARGGPFAGDLVWFDDRVRLVQIFNWLNGAGWYDRTILRVDAPEGFHSIWSRVVDLPVAGIIALLQNHIGQMQAGMAASIIMPLLQTLMLFGATAYFAQPLVGKPNAKLVTLFVIFTSAINPEGFTLAGFQVGMVGHHAWYVLATLMLFGAVARLILTTAPSAMFIAALSLCGLQVIGIEGLPLIAGAFFLVAVIGWQQNNPRLLRDALRFTTFGALGGFLLLPANQPPTQLLTVSYAEPSILAPSLIFAAALFFGVQLYVQRRWGERHWLALGITTLCALLIGLALIKLFPLLLDGGAAALSPEERQLAQTEHEEAMSLFKVATTTLDSIRMVVPTLMALAFGVSFMRMTAAQRQKTVAGFYCGLLVLAFLMASFYARYFHYIGLAASPLLLLAWLKLSAAMPHNDRRALKSFGLYFCLGPLWLWLVPAANYNLKLTTETLLFPSRLQWQTSPCDTRRITDYINRHYDADKTIIVPMYSSDEFLLHTPLKIFFLANFPSNNKFIEAKAFFDGTPAEAERIAASHPIDLVAVCTATYHMSEHSAFANQLMKGRMNFGQVLVTRQEPEWLRPIPLDAASPWLLFAVERGKMNR